MADEARSERVYWQYTEASFRFDYFVTGVCVALVGYLGANVESARLALTPAGIELVAVVLFLGASFAGFKHLEARVELMKLNYRMVHAGEAAGAHASVAASGVPQLNVEGGEVVTPDQASAISRAMGEAREELRDSVDTLVDTTASRYKTRNLLLILGLVALVVSRILPAYL